MPVKADNDNLIVARYYDNLADSKIIFSIKKENKGKAGIYRITNKINGKSYIGSSYRLHLRFYAYFSASGLKRTERVIVQAILKYGLINFSLEVLEYIEQKDLSIPFLLEREQYYLDLLKPEYNILKIAGSSKGFKYSEEDKIKLSQMRAKGKDHLWYGRKHTEESKLLMTLHNKNYTTIFCYIDEDNTSKKS
jgi:group I intron endonuclease